MIFSIGKIFIVCCYKQCALWRVFFGNVCVRQPRGVHGAAQFSWLKIYTGLKIQEIFPELFLEIGGLEVGLYLFGDSTYPT